MLRYLLISGVPSAGKSTLADRLEHSDAGFTHVPMDHYIRAVPSDTTFRQWVRTPRCVDWALMDAHLEILRSGRVCYSPRPDWSRGGVRISEGGPLRDGPGRRMHPSLVGYAIPGTHAFSAPASCKPAVKADRQIKSPSRSTDTVVATRCGRGRDG